jgi:hypothetical protein
VWARALSHNGDLSRRSRRRNIAGTLLGNVESRLPTSVRVPQFHQKWLAVRNRLHQVDAEGRDPRSLTGFSYLGRFAGRVSSAYYPCSQ